MPADTSVVAVLKSCCLATDATSRYSSIQTAGLLIPGYITESNDYVVAVIKTHD